MPIERASIFAATQPRQFIRQWYKNLDSVNTVQYVQVEGSERLAVELWDISCSGPVGFRVDVESPDILQDMSHWMNRLDNKPRLACSWHASSHVEHCHTAYTSTHFN